MESGDSGCSEEEMRHMMRQVLLFTIILTLSVFGMSCTGQPAGPWKAQVVDAETGKALEGVVVLAVWHRRYASPGGWAGGGYYASEEVVTRPAGRFVIPARWTFTLVPFLTTIKGPEFTIFKPGYGGWRIRDWEKKPKEWEELTAGEVLAKDGIVIELPRLKTREQRLKFYRRLRWSAPAERAKRLLDAVKKERAYLGFRN
jgi:hypothetical protein